MRLSREKRELLVKSIIKNISKNPKGIVKRVAEEFGITRQAVYIHVRKLISNNIIQATGKGRNTSYQLQSAQKSFTISVSPNMREDDVWREKIRPLLPDLEKNIFSICHYGFTEMLNNVIAHSESDHALITIKENALQLELWIFDYGIGIFNKLQQYLNLPDPKQAILGLAKGKLTTDPEHHTGEGIFFTSRIFDQFQILSGKLFFSGHKNDDWLLESEKRDNKGTSVFMRINKDSSLKIKDIFEEYAASGEDYGFSKTIIPMELLQYEGEELISRSQAKRLIVRFDRFKEVILDFKGIKTIGQPFADELFRVFKNQHPNVRLVPINANINVEKNIKRALNNH